VALDPGTGRRLREARQRLGLTQTQLANRLNLTRLSIARYEGGRIPRIEILRKIAEVTGTNVAVLLHEEPLHQPTRPKRAPIESRELERLLRQLQEQIEDIKWPTSPKARLDYERRIKTVLSRAISDIADYRAMLTRRAGDNK
jgi:transcriptional regulator with XRE-family HTH domain